jgi:hypothetical protein
MVFWGVDQPKLPHFKAYTNYDNYVGVRSWRKISLNNTDYNDQGAFDAANNHFVTPVDGTYLFGATLLYRINASATARMRGRLVLNGTSPSTYPARPPMTTPKRCARRPHVRGRARYDAGPRRRGRRAAGVAMKLR